MYSHTVPAIRLPASWRAYWCVFKSRVTAEEVSNDNTVDRGPPPDPAVSSSKLNVLKWSLSLNQTGAGPNTTKHEISMLTLSQTTNFEHLQNERVCR